MHHTVSAAEASPPDHASFLEHRCTALGNYLTILQNQSYGCFPGNANILRQRLSRMQDELATTQPSLRVVVN